jgi:2,3-bisphosphoglycerate-independent phosphoglycerate mutase
MCALLSEKIKTIDDVEVMIKPGMGHRFVVMFRGEGLAGGVSDTDPHHEGEPIAKAKADTAAAKKTADVVNQFVARAVEALAGTEPMNGVLTRGVSSSPDIQDLKARFKLDSAAIATYPMYRGLASLVGMALLDTGKSTEDEFRTYLDNYDRFDFFFIHVKGTDEAGEDGSFDRKVSVLEEFDAALPVLLEKQPEALAITGDHSTPCPMKLHSWHPVPLMIVSPRCGADRKARFTEDACNSGGLGIFESRHLMSLLLANAGKLDKFGA